MHKNTPPVPLTYGQERPASLKDIIKEAMEAYNIATQEEGEALKRAASQPLPDYGIEPDFEEVDATEESEEAVEQESEDVVEIGSD